MRKKTKFIILIPGSIPGCGEEKVVTRRKRHLDDSQRMSWQAI